jgi:hypothetical protein
MSASFQAWPGYLQTAANSSSRLPVGLQTPVASIETSGGSLHGCVECLFSLQRQLQLFFPESSQSDKSDNLE